MNTREYDVADLFCGAGGSSSGAEKAIEENGGTMNLIAINHWNTAIATHSANHPRAKHIVEDVSMVDPEAVVEKGRLDLLMASPECKFHSRARGGKPIHDQGRMHPWAIHNWLTKLDVRCVLVENVPEFVDWGPLGTDGRPDKTHRGEHFQAWYMTFIALGYQAEWKMLNAADHGDATTRTRFFLQARKDGRAIMWPEPSHIKEQGGMFPGRQKWRGAREIIDWTNPGRSLLDDPKYKKRPLSEKTRRRIARGLERFGGPMAPLYIRLLDLPIDDTQKPQKNTRAKPFILNRHAGNGHDRSHSVEEPVPTADTRGADHLVNPNAEPFHSSDRQHTNPRSLEEPLHTVTTLTGGGLYVVRPDAKPFIQANRNENSPKSLDEPIPTVTTAPGGGSFLVDPKVQSFTLGQQSQSAPRSTNQPIPTVATDGAISLTTPTILGPDGKAFMLPQHSTGAPRSTQDPTPTIMSDGGISLVQPLVIEYYNQHDLDELITNHGPGALLEDDAHISLPNPHIVVLYGQSKASDVDQPLPTVTKCNKHCLANPVLIEYYTGGSGSADIELPLPTVTTKDRHALTSPSLIDVNHGYGKSGEAGDGNRTQSVDEPIGAITTKRGMGLVDPVLIQANHGNGDEGNKGNNRRVHSVNEPLPAITTVPGIGLAEPILVQTGQTGGNGSYSRPVEEPLPVITTTNDIHVVTPEIQSYIIPNFGERDGQEPRVHDIDEPTPTITGRGAGNLVSPILDKLREGKIDPRRIVTLNGHPFILDIRFRMLQNKELAKAMGFDDHESEYEFVGNIGEVTKQIGNAVPVNLAAALVGAILRNDDESNSPDP